MWETPKRFHGDITVGQELGAPLMSSLMSPLKWYLIIYSDVHAFKLLGSAGAGSNNRNSACHTAALIKIDVVNLS